MERQISIGDSDSDTLGVVSQKLLTTTTAIKHLRDIRDSLLSLLSPIHRVFRNMCP